MLQLRPLFRDHVPLISQLTDKGWTTFISAEPLLEEINLGFGTGRHVDWVITGAESGRRARPMDEIWVRSLRDQCNEAKVAFFYKQDFKKGKKISLPELDGKQWAESTHGLTPQHRASFCRQYAQQNINTCRTATLSYLPLT